MKDGNLTEMHWQFYLSRNAVYIFSNSGRAANSWGNIGNRDVNVLTLDFVMFIKQERLQNIPKRNYSQTELSIPNTLVVLPQVHKSFAVTQYHLNGEIYKRGL